MTLILPFAAAATPEGTASAVSLEAALLLVIVVCLAFLAKAVADMSRRVQELTASRPSHADGNGRNAGPAAAPRTMAEGSPDPVTLAAITAAVYAACERPVRIVAVDEATVDQSRNWSLEGRRQIFTSHQVR